VGRRFFNRKKHRNSTLATWTLSFGRHQGQRLCDVPRDYLRWALTAGKIPAADLWVIQQFTGFRPKPSNSCLAGAAAPDVAISSSPSGEMKDGHQHSYPSFDPKARPSP
jgi:uncharacterized protein (DUF3820 family)